MFQKNVTDGFKRGFNGGLVDTAPYIARAYFLADKVSIGSVVSLVDDEEVEAGASNVIGVLFNQRAYAGELADNEFVGGSSVEVLEEGRFYLELAGLKIGDTLYSTEGGGITKTATNNTELVNFRVVSDSDANGIAIIEIAKSTVVVNVNGGE